MPILRKGERCPPGEERVNIRYFALKNTAPSGGWCPGYREGKHMTGDTYCRGLDRDVAQRVAKTRALEVAEKYLGDFCVIVGPGTPHTPYYLDTHTMRWRRAKERPLGRAR